MKACPRRGCLNLGNECLDTLLDVLQTFLPAVVVDCSLKEAFGLTAVEPDKALNLKVDDELPVIQAHKTISFTGPQNGLGSHCDVVVHLRGDMCEVILVGSLVLERALRKEKCQRDACYGHERARQVIADIFDAFNNSANVCHSVLQHSPMPQQRHAGFVLVQML